MVIAKSEELPEGGVIRRSAGAKEVAVFRREGRLYAIDAQCPHRGGPLDEANLEDGFIVVCPWHGWRFDIRDGKSPTHPGRVSCFECVEENGEILLKSS